VVDPADIGPSTRNGKIYVAEMIDYPDDPPPGKPPRSRIVLLGGTATATAGSTTARSLFRPTFWK